VFAATLIKKRWRAYKRSKFSRAALQTKVNQIKQKAAINRIARFSKQIKVSKVTAKCQLMSE
jgi:hypothetical protein